MDYSIHHEFLFLPEGRMKHIIRRAVLAVVSSAMVLVSAGCSPKMVGVPSAEGDNKPQITLKVKPVRGKVQDTRIVFDERPGSGYQAFRTTVSEGAEVKFAVTASNPGGVRKLMVRVIGPEGQDLYLVEKAAGKTEDNKGPKRLDIRGHDNAGGPGDYPLRVVFSSDDIMIVDVAATNFNGGTTIARVAFGVGVVGK